MPKILLIDDDLELTALLAEYLTAQHFHITTAENGEKGLLKINQKDFDLIVLDIMMPKMDGITLLKQLQHDQNNTPIIMLTAKDDDIDKIIGLELGADDYLAKPCNPRELVARINAILRRNKHNIKKTTSSKIHIDPSKRICLIHNKEIELTATEFDILYLLNQHQGSLVSKDTLSQKVLGRELFPFDRSIDVHISRLRKKLEKTEAFNITTIRGKGYQLTT